MDAFLRTWEEFVNIATIGNDFDRIVLSKVKPHYKNGKFIIVTKDEFTKTWIEKNYLDRIKSTFKYYDLDVEIVVENNVNQDNLKVEETKETKKYTMKENTTKTSKTSKISRENETEKIEGNVVVLEKSDEEKSFNYQVNPKYTFDSFVVGPSNDFAYHAALNVSKYPGKNYNPLFIYGGVGLGKTHLLHAIVNATTKETKLKKILYVTSEQFTNDFFKALNSKTLHSFRIKYREADILLIDDVQFFKSTMKQAIEELFHTFNKLIHDKKQMVFTSDRTPRELEEISDRMISRFEGGLVVEIRKPELETRIRIIEEKLKDEKIEIKDEYKRFIAENIVSNVRSLEA
ncbi:MAG: DnaA ATPase domain-containing protein, partial [Brevinematia bacterium]